MKTQSPTKNIAAKKNSTSSKKSPGSKSLGTTATSSTRDDENVRTNSHGGANNDEIAALAYKIWQEQGCPEGHEEQHWRQAEQAVARHSTYAVAS
ncbi:MAG: hypothetical protein JWR15_2301 [Prosthecobacter sp.]|nr:hypothetical protein [Prosthecobacter sp.]